MQHLEGMIPSYSNDAAVKICKGPGIKEANVGLVIFNVVQLCHKNVFTLKLRYLNHATFITCTVTLLVYKK